MKKICEGVNNDDGICEIIRKIKVGNSIVRKELKE